ncbi:MAG: hypothetical protein LQ339_000103 [Xanthoria mediterranea]|nr:MAG: hypothetical protein LQ339_000103 [Xanthoria mediterranea]
MRSPPSKNYIQFVSDAVFEFATFIGKPACQATLGGPALAAMFPTQIPTNGGSPVVAPATKTSLQLSSSQALSSTVITSAPNNTSLQTTVSAAASIPASPASSPVQERRPLSLGAKIGIGVAGLNFVLMITLAVAPVRYRSKSRLRKVKEPSSNPETDVSDGGTPYFQQKGELEGEERIKYELHAETCRGELEANEVHEMPTTRGGHGEGIVVRRNELRGQEHSRELE